MSWEVTRFNILSLYVDGSFEDLVHGDLGMNQFVLLYADNCQLSMLFPYQPDRTTVHHKPDQLSSSLIHSPTPETPLKNSGQGGLCRFVV